MDRRWPPNMHLEIEPSIVADERLFLEDPERQCRRFEQRFRRDCTS
jgi:hypothetical protein